MQVAGAVRWVMPVRLAIGLDRPGGTPACRVHTNLAASSSTPNPLPSTSDACHATPTGGCCSSSPWAARLAFPHPIFITKPLSSTSFICSLARAASDRLTNATKPLRRCRDRSSSERGHMIWPGATRGKESGGDQASCGGDEWGQIARRPGALTFTDWMGPKCANSWKRVSSVTVGHRLPM